MSSTPAVRLPLATPTAAGSGGLSFGQAFTSGMATASWTEGGGWSELDFGDRRPLLIDPAMVGLHYGQIVFEGLKAYRLPASGRTALFRPDAYAQRMARSAARLAMPAPPADLFLAAVKGVAQRDAVWLPADPDAALYLRPLMTATDPDLALRPSSSYLFLVIAFVTGGFFSRGTEPITVRIEQDHVRATAGGAGAAKCAGNYAPTYLAQTAAAAAGADQVVWLDSTRRSTVEELGGMNLFFVYGEGPDAVLRTPPLSDTILPGITRDSLIVLARDLGYRVDEQPTEVNDWRADALSGRITETFACGTAASVTPVGHVQWSEGSWRIGTGQLGPVTRRLSDALRQAWYGEFAGREAWTTVVGADAEKAR